MLDSACRRNTTAPPPPPPPPPPTTTTTTTTTAAAAAATTTTIPVIKVWKPAFFSTTVQPFSLNQCTSFCSSCMCMCFVDEGCQTQWAQHGPVVVPGFIGRTSFFAAPLFEK